MCFLSVFDTFCFYFTNFFARLSILKLPSFCFYSILMVFVNNFDVIGCQLRLRPNSVGYLNQIVFNLEKIWWQKYEYTKQTIGKPMNVNSWMNEGKKSASDTLNSCTHTYACIIQIHGNFHPKKLNITEYLRILGSRIPFCVCVFLFLFFSLNVGNCTNYAFNFC